MKLVSGPFAHAQPWSRGFYEIYPEIQGLYERADTLDLFPANTHFHRALADPLIYNVLTVIVDEIGYSLV